MVVSNGFSDLREKVFKNGFNIINYRVLCEIIPIWREPILQFPVIKGM